MYNYYLSLEDQIKLLDSDILKLIKSSKQSFDINKHIDFYDDSDRETAHIVPWKELYFITQYHDNGYRTIRIQYKHMIEVHEYDSKGKCLAYKYADNDYISRNYLEDKNGTIVDNYGEFWDFETKKGKSKKSGYHKYKYTFNDLINDYTNK